MGQYIDKDALAAEIDKRLHQLTDAAFDSMIGRTLIEIKDFIDTLEVKEEEPVTEDLVEAAKYHRSHGNYGGDINLAMEESFKAGAKWKEQLIKSIEK